MGRTTDLNVISIVSPAHLQSGKDLEGFKYSLSSSLTELAVLSTTDTIVTAQRGEHQVCNLFNAALLQVEYHANRYDFFI